MPTPATTDLPRPKSWDEFEDICFDILKRIWKDPYVARNGRSGQTQNGVDVFGHPEHLGGQQSGKFAAAQCKETDILKIATVKAEVKNAEGFKPALTEYLIMTTAPRDASLQEQIRTNQWPFRVQVLFWEDISLELSNHDDLLEKHFAGWMKKKNSKEQVLAQLENSTPSDFDYDDGTGVFVCKRDLKLRLVMNREGESEAEFHERWATQNFADPVATRQPVYVYYGETRVQELYFAFVDGARYLLPYPRSATDLTISRFQYQMAQILSAATPGGYGLDQGLRQAGIGVRDQA